MAVWLNTFKLRHEVAAGITVGMTAATTVKSRRIKRRNLVITAFIDHTEINLETAEQNVEHLVGIYIMSQYLSQRNGIGSVANKLTLVNIYSGAENTTADMASTDCTFRESAADFLSRQ